MSSDFTLMEEAGQFRAIVEKAEFSDHEGNSLDYEKGIQKNLGMLESLRDRCGNLFLVGNGGSAAAAFDVQVVCNRESITPVNLYKYINTLLKS